MQILKLVDEYTNVGIFEMVYKNKKLTISYYDEIIDFNDKRIKIKVKNNIITCSGHRLIIETMYKELIIISGTISTIEFGECHE